MRHLLTTIMVVAIISAAFTMLAGKCSANNDYDDSDTLNADAPVVEKIYSFENQQSDSAHNNGTNGYRRLPLTEYGNIKVYDDYCLEDKDKKYGDDVNAKDETYLIRYVDDKPKDSMILVGPYMRLLGEGSLCRIVVGVDTVDVNIKRPFGKTLDLRFRDALTGCKFYRLSRHYAINDSARSTDFQINIAMRDSTPLFIKDFISDMIRNDVAAYFEELKDDKWIAPYVPMILMRNRTVEQMMEHYYYQFRNLYDKEFKPEPGSDERAYGEWFSYQCYAYPVWQNSDSTLTTWKFYNYSYMGGAHGGECEYFLTFDNLTGRILGASDFFSKDGFGKAIKRLAGQLDAYHGYSGFEADLNSDSEITATQSTTMNEVIEGKIYPRPAITKQGIVFSYQTYEKGSNPDGVMHFTQPFKNMSIYKSPLS